MPAGMGNCAWLFVLAGVLGQFTAGAAGLPSGVQWLSIDGKQADARTEVLTVSPQRVAAGAAATATGEVFEVRAPGALSVSNVERDGNAYQELSVPGCGFTAEQDGLPSMPFKGFLVEVPYGVSVGVELIDTKAVLLGTGFQVHPQQAPEPDNAAAPPPFVRNAEAYGRDARFPETPVKVGEPGVIRGRRVVFVQAFPLKYNPKTTELLAFSPLRFRLTFSGTQDESGPARKARLATADSERFADALVLNYTPAESAPVAAPAALAEGGSGADYLILAADTLAPAVQPLADWKYRKGFLTRVVKMSDVGTTSSAILSYLRNAYNTWTPAPSFVLLVGDSGDIPPAYYSGSEPCSSDHVYACLDGTDVFPDVTVGRIPVRTVQDCTNVVNKILTYERTPDPGSWYHHVLSAGYLQDYDDHNYVADRWFMETTVTVYDFLVNSLGWQGHTALNTDYWPLPSATFRFRSSSYPHRAELNQVRWGVSPYPDPIPAWVTALWTSSSQATSNITSAINGGVGLVQHRDHGGETGWGDPPYYVSNVNGLSNGVMTPVVFSTNCLTGTFTYSSDCFCEAFLKKYPGGAVGIMGSTQVSYSGHNDLLTAGTYTCFYPEYDPTHTGNRYASSWRPSQAVIFGKYYMFMYEGSGGITDGEFYMFHWFGDPEMELRTVTPKALTVTHPVALPFNQATNLTVSVADAGVPVSGALVCLSHPTEAGQHWAGTTASDGTCTFSKVTLTLRENYNLVVTAHDFRPYEGTIAASVTSLGFVSFDKETYVCPDTAQISLGDQDLAGQGTRRVALAASNGDVENVTMQENATVPGLFAQAVSIAAGAANPEDGILQVSNGTSITVTYEDADDGSGNPATVEDTATIDSLAPSISGVSVRNIGKSSATIVFDTDESAIGRVRCGSTCGGPYAITVDEKKSGLTHSFSLSGLDRGATYYFVVDATDAYGNSGTDNNGGTCYSFSTLSMLTVPFFDDFESGSLDPWDINVGGAGDAPLVRNQTSVLGVGAPKSGTHVAYLGDSSDDYIAHSTMEIVLDLSHLKSAELRLWCSTYELESDNWFQIDVYDGVWHNKVVTYSGTTWQQLVMDLSSYNLIRGFVIRLHSVENYTEGTDAVYVDDVSVTGVVEDSLAITPSGASADLKSSGYMGGPFTPASKDYEVTNAGADSFDWSVAAAQPWVQVSPASGTLAAGGSATVTVSLGALAETLFPGISTNTVAFTNTSTGFTDTRGVELTVSEPLAVTPVNGISAMGPSGGPFTPASSTYTVTNRASIYATWTAVSAEPWMDINPSGGTLGQGETATVAISVNAAANALFPGTYSNTITFMNSDTNVRAERGVALIVQEPLTVTPSTGVTATGAAGGPFTPASAVYVLANTGQSDLPWTAVSANPWMDVNPPGGTLVPGATAEVTVAFNSAANALVPSSYVNTITFANTATTKQVLRSVGLIVQEPFLITPSTGLVASGMMGGPFTPASAAYLLTNTGAVDLPWTAVPAHTWLDVSPSSGILTPGESVTVTAAFGAAANALPPSTYSSKITFKNGNTGFQSDRSAALTIQEPLAVTPSNGLTASGVATGSITPSSADYTLANAGSVDVPWTASSSVSWLDVSTSSGTLVAGGSVTITASFNAGATSLAPGIYTATLVFSNTVSGSRVSRAVSLTLSQPFTVTPSTGLTSTGLEGGPFTPGTATYTVTNTGTVDILWTAKCRNSWLDVTPLAGILTAGESAPVTVSFNAAANSLASGTYSDTLTLYDLLNNYTLERGISLKVLVRPGKISVTDSILPADDGSLPYGVRRTGSAAVTEHVTVSNVDPVHNLTVNSLHFGEQNTEDFESGNLSGYTSVGGAASFALAPGAAHEGGYGLEGSSSFWMYRNDASVRIAPGQAVSCWVRPESSSGNFYFGFGSSASGTYSLVVSTASNALILQRNASYTKYTVLAEATRSWSVDKWYRLEAEWRTGGTIVGRLYDSDGVTLLNTLTASDSTYATGGIAFRSTARVQFDTVTRHSMKGGTPFELANVPSLPATLHPNESLTADVIFHPDTAGVYTDQVVVESNDIDTPRALVDLSGSVVNDPMAVTPEDGFYPMGPTGGPFVPSSARYTLTNGGSDVIQWTATTDAAWVDVSVAGGSLDPAQQVSVTVSLNAAANLLPTNVYEASVVFTDTTTGCQCTRHARLVVRTIYVDKRNTSGQEDGLSWATAFSTIPRGITAAAASGGDVWVATGSYPTAIMLQSQVHVYGGFAGTETQRAQRDPVANVTTINVSGGVAQYHVVDMRFVYDAGIDGFHISGGYANGGSLETTSGAGVHCANIDSSCVIANCVIHNNVATARGGGIYCYPNASPRIENCVIAANTASHGGGVFCEGDAPAISQCRIFGNKASVNGGGVFCQANAVPTITNCDISGNLASNRGGGMYCQTNSTATVTNCTFSINWSGWISGGGICANITASPVITNCVFARNAGYAIHEASADSDPVVRNCLFYLDRYAEYFDENTTDLKGAAAINGLAGNSGNVDGPVQFAQEAGAEIKGTWTAAAVYDAAKRQTTLTDARASFVPGALVYRMLQVKASENFLALVVGNTATEIVVSGDVTSYGPSGGVYRMADFRLTNGSTGIDTGFAMDAITEDILGNARPVDIPLQGQDGTGTEYDIGAYECVDGTPPEGSIVIDGGAAYTNSRTLLLALDASDAGSGVTRMRISDDGVWDTERWEDYTPSKSWTLNGGEGARTIYAQYADAAGNASTVSSDSILLDATPPVATLACNAPDPVNVPVTVNVTLSEPSPDFSEASIVTINATVENFAGSDTAFSFTLAPVAQGPCGCSIPEGAFVDMIGNPNEASNEIDRTYDSIPPSLSMTSTAPEPTTQIPIPVSVTFSEPVADFEAADVALANAVLTNFAGGGTDYTFELLPIGSGLVSATIDAGACSDPAGNPNEAETLTRTYDIEGPYPTLSSAVPDPTNATEIAVRVMFDELVTDFDAADIQTTNATVANFAGTGAVYTFGLVPIGQGVVSAVIPGGVCSDSLGNRNAPSDPFTRTSDTMPPTPMLESSSPDPTNQYPISVTLAFNESVFGFDAGGITASNATVENFMGSGGDYAFELIPTGHGPVSAKVVAGVCTDRAGNGNAPSTLLTREYDIQGPVPTFYSPTSDPTNALAIPVMVTFDEPATGFDATDIVATNATVDRFTGSGLEYYFELIPSGQGTVSAELAEGVCSDAIGNPNAGGVLTRSVDTVPPTAEITLLTPTPTGADTVSFNVKFSKPVGASFSEPDVSACLGGLAGAFVVSGTDPEYTVTLQLSDSDADGLVGIVIGAGVTDLAGNAFAGGASPTGQIYNWHGFRSEPNGIAKVYAGGAHTFDVQPDCGAGNVEYRWWFDNGTTPAVRTGSDAPSLTVDPVTADSDGDYWCEIAYDGACHTSRKATLAVAEHLRIAEPPLGAEMSAGESYTLRVVARGGFPPLTYQWKKDAEVIPDANDETLAFSPLSFSDAGVYAVDISDALNDSVTSDPVELVVVPGVPAEGLIGGIALLITLIGCATRKLRRS